ncbi:MAG TPA: restriction endonuclease [Candidatus Caccosoma faecigallinarum]|uniref:Restriction endonuclease n=1 Tax=Candidatus Caccosoma faecigallinarum TaxID=2840720 RepID=A0A9D1KAK2_9FIRM|nr:restriction endonuclease [Candidatus Caccosoma faecigallinarum]
MAVPGFQEFMFPILKLLSDGKTYYKRDIFKYIANEFNLTKEQIEEKLPSQTEPTYINRIGWAITYLKKAGLLSSPTRAHYKISKEGKNVVDNNITNLNSKYLRKYESFLEFQNLSSNHNLTKNIPPSDNEKEFETPSEKMISYYELIKKSVCDDLLNKVIDQTPDFFEQLVIDLIVSMGYGGSLEDAGRATKRTNDEGIDGLVKEDKLGLDTIYIQAKRWQKGHLVGRPEIQKFVGALAGQGARKGIFITTSNFTKEAVEYKPRNDTSIILIDGQKLVELMFEYNIGVSTEKCFYVKRIDSDYFESI